MKNTAFWSNYTKWEEQAACEFRESEFWQAEYENHFEIAENGNVYLGGLHWIHGVCTKWVDSEFYTG